MHSYITVGLLVCVALVAALPENWQNTYKTYKGYKVFEVVPKSRREVDVLREWMLNEIHFDFWKEPSKSLEPVHIMVNARQASRLTVKLRKQKMTFSIYKDNIDRDIQEFMAKEMKRRNGAKKVFDINDFNSYDDIMTWLRIDLPALCEENDISYNLDDNYISHEGRVIPVVTMSTGGENQPLYFMDATIHAREWLATATILKIMDHLANGNDGEILAANDFVFMPVYNPDGYVYSWDDERLWRKNRNPQGACVGIDLNRNCDYMFGEEGVSNNPCSDTYCGSSGNSEQETIVFDTVMRSYLERPKRAYITFHSYGNMWMHPWGNTVNNAGFQCERADDHDEMFAVADATADAIQAVHNTQWARGTSCEVIYETTGATDDYAKAVLEWQFPFTPELRGNGFIVDPDQIQPSFEEVWAGILAKEGALP